MNPFSLENKTILITGASGGIGSACTQQVLAMGGKVIGTSRSAPKNQDNFQFIEADLRDADSIERIVKETGNIDGIIHAAGMVKPLPVKFIKGADVKEMFQVNYEGPVLLTNDLLKAKKLQRGSSIVFISSISCTFAYKGGALYTGSKAALNAFSKVLALELAHQKIRSNCILAAMVRTTIYEQAEKAIGSDLMNEHAKAYPLGIGDPTDIANACCFLLSDASRWISGTELVMDGGLTAGT
jgi:NAD(P)-dependent dehydrogenase (short-subunit alcohol dehydrogenase family)